MKYDEVYDLTASIDLPEEEGKLNIEWVIAERLAVGRDKQGRHVVLLPGPSLEARLPTVARALSRGRWISESGSSIVGTLLRLSDGSAFLVASTTIVIELLRRDIATRPSQDVFREVEPFIELVIRRLLLPPESILGLVGELLTLDYILAGLPEDCTIPPTSIWKGYMTRGRDFVFNRLALETKATSGVSSVHTINNLDQVEPSSLQGGGRETLFLVSIGLQPDVAGSTRFSVSRLVGSILDRLSRDDQEEFKTQVRQYGPPECVGYDHDNMSEWETYTQCFRPTFEPRLYDMGDPNLRVIRRLDLQDLFVLPEGLSYRVHLPDEIPSSHGKNPRSGLTSELVSLLREHS